jgi:hypothetical protein
VTRAWKFVPAAWPDSNAENWLQQQASAYALSREAPPGAGVDALCRTSLHDLRDVIAKVGTPSCFKRYAFKPSMMSDRQLSTSTWMSEHIQKGFWGRQLEGAELRAPVFKEWDLMIELIGNLVVAGRAAASVR